MSFFLTLLSRKYFAIIVLVISTFFTIEKHNVSFADPVSKYDRVAMCFYLKKYNAEKLIANGYFYLPKKWSDLIVNPNSNLHVYVNGINVMLPFIDKTGENYFKFLVYQGNKNSRLVGTGIGKLNITDPLTIPSGEKIDIQILGFDKNCEIASKTHMNMDGKIHSFAAFEKQKKKTVRTVFDPESYNN